MRKPTFIAALGLAAITAAGLATPTLSAGDRPGRYTMAPAEGGGFARLDTETGAMALCTRKDGQWACAEMPDATRDLRKENERLTAENKELKADIHRMEEMLGLGDGKKRPERPGLQLPSEEDVDKALSYIERMFKKFRDKMKQFEGDSGRGGTPL